MSFFTEETLIFFLSDHAVSVYHLVVFISESKHIYVQLKHQAHIISCNFVS